MGYSSAVRAFRGMNNCETAASTIMTAFARGGAGEVLTRHQQSARASARAELIWINALGLNSHQAVAV